MSASETGPADTATAGTGTTTPNPAAPTVVITGAAGGIGRAACVAMLAEGWNVVGAGRNRPEDLSAYTLFITADVGRSEDCERLISEAAALDGRITALVNNAAAQVCKPLVETGPEEWDALMAVNLRAPYLLARAAYPHLSNGGGSIVNVSSVHAVATSANIACYAASKGGLTALTRAMAIEFAPDGVRVNSLLPGAVDTPMLRDGLGRGHLESEDVQGRLDDLAAKTVNGRVGLPEEIAPAIRFLCLNSESSFMTGQSMIVDGGATCRLSTE